MSDKRRRRRQNSEGSEHSESDETESKDGVEEVDIDKDEGVVSCSVFLTGRSFAMKMCSVVQASATSLTPPGQYFVDIQSFFLLNCKAINNHQFRQLNKQRTQRPLTNNYHFTIFLLMDHLMTKTSLLNSYE